MKALYISLIALVASAFSLFGDSSFSDEEVSTTFSAKEVEVMPIPVNQSQPNIPSSLKGVAGKVFVGFIVDESGKVVSPRVLKTENESLNEIAMDCVAKWKFKPAQKDGANVSMRVVVPIRFA
jgi:periplasmic protein TonB